MKQNIIIPVILSLVLFAGGLLNIFLWYSSIVSIYGLVVGVFSIVLACFVFLFRRRDKD